MNDFIKVIKETPNHRKMVLDELKNARGKVPLILYGAGWFAPILTKYLLNHGIEVRDCFIDDVQNSEVKSFEDICNNYEKFDVIIGFQNYILARENLKKQNCQKIRNIFSIDVGYYDDAKTIIDQAYFDHNKEKFLETYDLFDDERSKETFVKFVQAKISGNNEYLANVVGRDSYFHSFLPITENEVFVDGGAFDGDTLKEFAREVNGKYKKYYAFEPDTKNTELLKKFIEKRQFKNIQTIEKGLWSKKDSLKFNATNDLCSNISETGASKIEVDSIDRLCSDASFIKMDIEGSELEALKGARNTIIKNKPKLAICVYHKPEDVFEIPLYIKSLVPDYHFFLRQHKYISVDLVLYAI